LFPASSSCICTFTQPIDSMSMQMLCLGLVHVAIVMTLGGCGGGGDPPSPTPAPPGPTPPPVPPSPTPPPAPPSPIKYYSTELTLGAGHTLSGVSSASVTYDVTMSIVMLPALKKLYKEHRDAFMPNVAKQIDAVIDADENLAGPAMSLMMTGLQAPLSTKGKQFLLAMDSSDSLTKKVELKGDFTVKCNTGSMIPRTYYPCIKLFEIDFSEDGRPPNSLMGLNTDTIISCTKDGTHGEKERMTTIV